MVSGSVAVVVFSCPAVNAARRRHGVRGRLAGHEVDDVGLVDQKVGGDAAGIIPIEAPLEVAARIPGALRGGSQEPVEVGVLAWPRRATVLAVPGKSYRHAACRWAARCGTRRRARSAPRRSCPARSTPWPSYTAWSCGSGCPPGRSCPTLPRLDDVPAFLDGVGERFFQVDVLTRVERGDGHVVMQVLRGHDVHRIDALVGQQIAVVLVRRRACFPRSS